MLYRSKLLGMILLLFLNGILWGTTIDEEIEAIQQAPVEQRFELMNALKKKIVEMKEEERMQSIEKLQQATQGEVIDADSNETQEQNRTDMMTQKIEQHTRQIIENQRESIMEEHHHEHD